MWLIVAAVVLGAVASWPLLGGRGSPSDAWADVPYAGSLGVINDIRVVERRLAEELGRDGLPAAGGVDLEAAVRRCLDEAVAADAQGPLRLVAEVRIDGTDVLALVRGPTGEVHVDLRGRTGCDPIADGP